VRRETAAIRGHDYSDQFGAPIPPIYVSATYRQVIEAQKTDRGNDLKYSREDNPTTHALEHILAKLDGGADAIAFNSGMAAITATLMYLMDRGDRLVTTMELYGGTLRLIDAMSEKIGFAAAKTFPDTEAVIEEVKRGAKLVFVETVTNPMLRVIDVPEVVKAARDVGARVVVDNTLLSPALFRPIEHGADMTLHSLTKYIAGHNDVVGGVVVAADQDDALWLYWWRMNLGTILQPMEAYLVMRGVETLFIRMRRHCENAKAVAEHLAEHPKIREVIWPGLPTHPHHSIAKKLFEWGCPGSVVSFRIRGGQDEVREVLNALRIITPSPSLGATQSIITYPITSASASIPEGDRKTLGITEDLLRLSVGLEDPQDIIEDLDQALSRIP